MVDGSLAPTLVGILAAFSECFTKPGFRNFSTLVTGWILCQGRHSISRVIQAAGPLGLMKSHSSFYRFLSHGSWLTDNLGRCLFGLLVKYLPEEVIAIVDDTLCIKEGPHIFGAGMHPDISRSSYGRGSASGGHISFSFGHSWVVLAIWVPLPWNKGRGFALPILFRLYRSKKITAKTKYTKRTELAAELVEVLQEWVPKGRRLHVVGDGEYSCKTLVRDLPGQVTFTGQMVMDAALYEEASPSSGRGRPRKKGKRLRSPEKIVATKSTRWEPISLSIYGRDVEILVFSFQALWYTVAGTRPVRVVITRDPKRRIDERAYFCTDPSIDPTALIAHYACRWELEVTFRNGKQLMGIEDPQNGWWRRATGSPRPKKKAGPNPKGRRGEKAVLHTLPLSFVVYVLVVLWYFKHGNPDQDVARVRKEAPWYRKKTAPSFADMLAVFRRELWIHRFSAHPALAGVTRIIRNLLPHNLLAS